jgi:hypothetical protein
MARLGLRLGLGFRVRIRVRVRVRELPMSKLERTHGVRREEGYRLTITHDLEYEKPKLNRIDQNGYEKPNRIESTAYWHCCTSDDDS